MKQKIMIGSIFVAFILVSIPFISVAQEQQEEAVLIDLTEDPEALLTILVENLQAIHDYLAENYEYIVENYPEIADEIDLEEFQNSINIISQGFQDNPLFCIALFLIKFTLMVLTILIDVPLKYLVIAARFITEFFWNVFCTNLSIMWRKKELEPCGCSSTSIPANSNPTIN